MAQKVKNSRLLRVLDLVSNAVMCMGGAQEQMEEKSIRLRARAALRSISKKSDSVSQESEGYLLIVGQVPTDANFLLHSHFSNHLELIEKCRSEFSGEIVFREHPLYRGMYEPDLYEYADDDKNIRISRDTDLKIEISKAIRVIVVNSTVGLEMLLNYSRRPVCLGASAYQQFSFTNIPSSISKSSDLLNDREKEEVNKWFYTNFLTGHFRDSDLSTLVTSTLEKVKKYA